MTVEEYVASLLSAGSHIVMLSLYPTMKAAVRIGIGVYEFGSEPRLRIWRTETALTMDPTTEDVRAAAIAHCLRRMAAGAEPDEVTEVNASSLSAR